MNRQCNEMFQWDIHKSVHVEYQGREVGAVGARDGAVSRSGSGPANIVW
jgi:hypothetical protein